jgi:hypothetical protein
VTDQPPSHQPAEEPEGDEPAALVTDDAPAQVSAPNAAPPPPPPPAPEPPSSEAAPTGADGLAAAFPSDRPERAVGAAFAGGIVLALILKRLAR